MFTIEKPTTPRKFEGCYLTYYRKIKFQHIRNSLNIITVKSTYVIDLRDNSISIKEGNSCGSIK